VVTERSIAGRHAADLGDANRDDAEHAVRFARLVADTVAKSFGA
jgi:hypothetical protein